AVLLVVPTVRQGRLKDLSGLYVQHDLLERAILQDLDLERQLPMLLLQLRLHGPPAGLTFGGRDRFRERPLDLGIGRHFVGLLAVAGFAREGSCGPARDEHAEGGHHDLSRIHRLSSFVTRPRASPSTIRARPSEVPDARYTVS